MSTNVIKFPERRSASRKPDAPNPRKRKSDKKAVSSLFADGHFVGMLLIGISLFSLNYKFFGGDVLPVDNGIVSERGVASIDRTLNLTGSQHFELARRLASSEVIGPQDPSIGIRPSLEDQVRHGVLASRAYVFQKSIKDGSVVSVRLQSDSDVPAYFLDPESFIREYGPWLNNDFLSAELKDEEVVQDKKISHFLIFTKSGEEFAVRIERDLYQRLKSISQTQVAGNSFN